MKFSRGVFASLFVSDKGAALKEQWENTFFGAFETTLIHATVQATIEGKPDDKSGTKVMVRYINCACVQERQFH